MRKFLFLLALCFLVGGLSQISEAADGYSKMTDKLFGPRMGELQDDAAKLPSDRLVHVKSSAWMALSGEIELNIVRRNKYLLRRIPDDVTTPADRESNTIWDPDVKLSMDFFAGRDVHGMIVLKTPDNSRNYFGTSSSEDGDPRFLTIREAYVKVGSLFPDMFGEEKMQVKVGIMDVIFDLRGRGNPFFMAIGESECAFHAGRAPDGTPGLWDTTDRATSNLGYFEFSGAGNPSLAEFGGFWAVYDDAKRTGFKFDLLFGITEETYGDRLDKSLGMAAITYALPGDTGKVHAFVSMFSNNPQSQIWSVGLGCQYIIGNSVEIFGEMVSQSGTFLAGYDAPADDDEALRNPYNLGVDGEDIGHLAFGGYGGFRYTYNRFWKPFFEISYWYLTGDHNQANKRQQNFISYEDVNDTFIFEDSNYGLDIDTNYEAVKFTTGFEPIPNQMIFEVLFGNFSRARDTESPTTIGNEVDLRLKWEYTEGCVFMLGYGHAFNLKYIEELDKKNMNLLVFNVKLKF